MTDTNNLQYVRACALSELPPEGAIGVEVAGEPVAVVRVQGEVYALRDVCSHAEVPLSEGDVYDHTIECWLHGSCSTCAPASPPGTRLPSRCLSIPSRSKATTSASRSP